MLNTYGYNDGKKIVISGTYGVGKTTTAKKLSELTRIPLSVARGMRDILPEEFPGLELEDASPDQLLQLGMVRYGERVKLEGNNPQGFISDGSVIHEWAYGYGRELEGANGNNSTIYDDKFQFAMKAYGDMVKRYAGRQYTDIIPIPVEFSIPNDGHRPVSEAFRNKADEIIMGTWEELGFTYHTVTGSIDERIEQIVDILGLKVSQTLKGPIYLDEGTSTFENSEDALGDANQRYFSQGFKNVDHKITDIKIEKNRDLGHIASVVHISSCKDWSVKNGKTCTPHFTSIDSILITGQLTQMLMYAQDGIDRDTSNNLWLRKLTIKPGKEALDTNKGIQVTLEKVRFKKLKMGGSTWHTASIVCNIGDSGFIVEADVAYELDKVT